MAYRQLRAVTFAVLGFAVGCGGGTASNTSPATDEQEPPSSSDQPPTSSDQPPAPSGSDQAPGSTDQPPASADTPAGSGGGGLLGDVCQQFCQRVADAVNQCTDGMTVNGTDRFCSQAKCSIPANTPCQSELVSFLDCFLGLDTFCKMPNGDASGGDTPSQDQTQACLETSSKDLQACAKAHGLSDGNDMPMPVKNCTPAGDCECPNDCSKCTCQAGTDLDALAACATPCAP